jgi:hypothetical protein
MLRNGQLYESPLCLKYSRRILFGLVFAFQLLLASFSKYGHYLCLFGFGFRFRVDTLLTKSAHRHVQDLSYALSWTVCFVICCVLDSLVCHRLCHGQLCLVMDDESCVVACSHKRAQCNFARRTILLPTLLCSHCVLQIFSDQLITDKKPPDFQLRLEPE